MNEPKTSRGLSDLLARLLQTSGHTGSRDAGKKPRICFVNSTKTWGGGERWHFENAVYASEAGFDVSFAGAPESVLQNKAAEQNLPFFPIRLGNLSFLNPFKLQRLWRYFKRQAIDVLVFNGPADLKTGGIAGLRAGVPVRIYRRGLAKAPNSGFLNRFLFNYAVTDFIVNSKATADLLFGKHTIPKEKARVHLLYNGLKPHPLARPENQMRNTIVLGNASRFVEQKGLHYLIEMADIIRKHREDFIIRIAGSGPLEQSLKEQTEAKKLSEFVHFPGFVSDVRKFVSDIDMYVCTSVFEGFGFSIAEAMHAGRPVVAFDVSSNPEIIKDGQTGFLVPAFDVETMAGKVMMLMDDEEMRERLGKAGKSRALEKFNKAKQQKTFCELVHSLIQRESGNHS